MKTRVIAHNLHMLQKSILNHTTFLLRMGQMGNYGSWTMSMAHTFSLYRIFHLTLTNIY